MTAQALLKDGLAGWTSGYLPHWSRDGNAIVGTDGKVDPDNAGGRIETGEPRWANYEFSARIRPISGVMAQLHYRLCEKGKCWYTLDLVVEEATVSLSRVDMRPGGPGRQILHSARVPLEFGRDYDAKVVAQYATLTTFLDGNPMNSVSDIAKPFLTGQVGVAIWMCRASFADPLIRFLD